MPASSETDGGSRLLAGVAWVAMLLVSELPEVVLHHAGARAPEWMTGVEPPPLPLTRT